MRQNIVISGYGGQGIMLTGVIICKAAIFENKFATFFPSYGAEVRGGAAKAQVIISDEYIGSPIVDSIDIFLSFSRLAYDKYARKVVENGMILTNSDMVEPNLNDKNKNIKHINIPANSVAENIGNKLASNMVILGAFAKHCPLLKKESFLRVIEENFKAKGQKLVDLNNKAFESGFNV